MKRLNSLLGALLLIPLLASAAPKTVAQVAEGEAAVVRGDEASALDAALQSALRRAVEQVAGVRISSDTVTRDAELVRDQIYASSDGYVSRHEVLSKGVENGVAKVKVRAHVGLERLDEDIAAARALVRRLANRKLIVLVQEQTIDPKGVTTSSGNMAGVLTEGFGKDGWTLVDPAFTTGKLRLGSGVAIGATDAKEIGQISKADYILYGTVSLRQEDVPEKGSMLSGSTIYLVTGHYDLTVFDTDTGMQLGTIDGRLDIDTRAFAKRGYSATVSYARTANSLLEVQGERVLKKMRKLVLDHLRDSQQNGQRLVMAVDGLPEFRAVANFQKVLSELKGMREVRRDKFSKGKASYNLTYLGSPDRLAEELGGKLFDGKRISVTGLSSSTVEITLAP